MAEQAAFIVYQPGGDPELAFLAAVGAARADHGYTGYSGNIGEKLRDGYSIVEPNPVTYQHARHMAERIIDADMTIVQPFGPVCAIACANGPSAPAVTAGSASLAGVPGSELPRRQPAVRPFPGDRQPGPGWPAPGRRAAISPAGTPPPRPGASSGAAGWLFVGRAPLISDVGLDQIHISRTLRGLRADPHAIIQGQHHTDG